jgi:hypothetical protein
MSLDPYLDPAADFPDFDNEETVQYLSRGSGEVFTDPNVPALVRRPREDEADFAGSVGQVFHILIGALTFPAKPRDHIVRADGTTWVVQDLSIETVATRYRLVCREAHP